MRIAVNFAFDVPDEALPALIELAAVEPGDRAGARRFVQAEAEQNVITYLTDNGVSVSPIRGVAFTPDDYAAGVTGSNPSGGESRG